MTISEIKKKYGDVKIEVYTSGNKTLATFSLRKNPISSLDYITVKVEDEQEC